jgi:hypothetical protein
MADVPDTNAYPDPVDTHRERLSIDELSAVTGVSRRTVHYYVQRRLIDPPLGRGRGRHYDRRHALQILNVRDLQRRGVALSAMVDGVPRPAGQPGAAPQAPVAPADQPAAADFGAPRVSAGASISSVVRIQVDKNVTVELAAGLDDITGAFVDALAAAVARVIAKHRGSS